MYSLLQHNTFGIDAQCADFIEYASVDELCQVLPQIKDKHLLHIGEGSNLLFVNDFDGIILHSQIKDCSEIKRTADKVWVRAGAGVNWDEFVDYCVNHHFYGLENLSYIPGEVGASAVQNIGAYGKEVGDFIEKVETIEIATSFPRIFSRQECEYAYRSSVFKKQLKGQYIVTHVVYCLDLQFKPDLEYAAIRREIEQRNMDAETLSAEALRHLIIDIRKNKLPDPKEIGSAGSFFMNPIVDNATFQALQEKYPQVPHYPTDKGVKVPAGWLIEQCGWKGKSMGKAGVYSKQALVLVNLGGATGADIVQLSDAICKDVYDKFQISIHPEVNFIY